jgi:hypothetical protein
VQGIWGIIGVVPLRYWNGAICRNEIHDPAPEFLNGAMVLIMLFL